MHLKPLRVITLVLCSFCSFCGVFAAGDSAPVQGYLGQGIGKSSNFMITNSYQAQYRYIQLNVDPEVIPTPPSSGGGGAQGPETSNTQYKTQICQCDGGGNPSCVNAFVQDPSTQNCLKNTPDKQSCLVPWALTKNYQLCSAAEDCSCGDEPLYPSAPTEPESPTEENTPSPVENTDEESTNSESEAENPNPNTDVDGSLQEETTNTDSTLETNNPESPNENTNEDATAETPDLTSDGQESNNPAPSNNSTSASSGNTNSSGSGNASENNSPTNIFDPSTFGELGLQSLLNGKGLFGEIYDPSKHTNLWFPGQEEAFYTAAPEEPKNETCVSCQQIWFNHLRVNICILFWITLGLLVLSIGTNIFWLKKYKHCHTERKFLLTNKRIQPKK